MGICRSAILLRISQLQTCSHDDVCDVRLAIPGRVQRAVVCFGEHDGNNRVPLVRAFAVKDQYKSAVLISGLVTFIAAYHYIRIFNSWVEAYHYSVDKADPELTGVPFNDAYRYMDWLLTVPLLLIEILLVMKLSDADYSSKAWNLGVGSALMIVSGYYGELTVTGDLTPRWICWLISMMFFLYIVYELLVGLSAATNSEADPTIKSKIQTARIMTVISWCTYPIVYLFPMLGINAAQAVVSIQIGYCASDIISKCGVGLLIYQITYAKSNKEALLA